MRINGNSIFFMVFLFVLSIANGYGQDKRKLDSLKQVLAKTTIDTQRVKILNSIAFLYLDTDSSELIRYREQAFAISKKINYSRGYYSYYQLHAVPAYIKGKYSISEEYGRRQLNMALQLKDSSGILDASFLLLASILYQEKSFKAEQATIKRLDSIPEKFGSPGRMASLYHFLGNYYFDTKPELTKYYFELSNSNFKKANNPLGLYINYADQAYLMLMLKRTEHAEKYADSALSIAEKIQPQGGFGYLSSMNTLGVIRMLNNNPKGASSLFTKLIKAGDSIRNEIKESEQRANQLELQKLLRKEEQKRKNLIISIIIIISVLIIFASWRYLRHFQQQKVEKLKKKISMDLHDEIGTIMNKSLLALKSLPEAEKKRFEHIIEHLQEGTISLREYVKNMSYNKISIVLLYDEVVEFINTFLSNTSIDFSPHFSGVEKFVISAELSRDIKLCIFEAANNMVKYSEASLFELSMIQEDDRLLVMLKDNGMLKSIDKLKGSGNGIRNIRQRTERNNGEVEYRLNESGSGLCIEMTFKL